MAIQKVKHIILIPVGPEMAHEFVHDTLESIRHYTDPDRRIILIDDRGTNDRFQVEGEDIDVLVNSRESGKNAKLHFALNDGIKYAMQNYYFQVMLRMDDDALFIGYRPEDDAIYRFQAHPNTGQLGSYNLTCMGYHRDLSWPAQRLEKEMDMPAVKEGKDSCKTGALAKQLKRVYASAREHGYQPGEHCIGAATYYSYECLKRLIDQNLLDIPELATSLLADDHLIGLLIRASGMEIEDFTQDADPLCLDWLNLPCAPDEIIARGKKITHSVKRWQDLEQSEIRAFFRARRRGIQ